MDANLIALYEIKRQAFLFAYIQNPENFSPALAYAYDKRIAPIFHEVLAREAYNVDPFDDIYLVKKEFVDAVTKYIDVEWRANNLKAITFYDLEDKFGGYKANRVELIYLLEYTRINGPFDEEVWKAIEANAPMEASKLASEFSPKEVSFS